MLNGNGPLATFSSRIGVAYLLGLLPSVIRRDPHLIRKIRNDFAHSAEPLSFQFPAIASRCNELKRAILADKPRWKFIQAAMSCGGVIDGEISLLTTGEVQRCMIASDSTVTDPNIVKMGLKLLANQAEQMAKKAKDTL
jgi:DNA-binding MltR family transcriptional regulator